MRGERTRIFVGGLGRSGTTLLAETIGRHPDVYAMEWETRFIVDNDGLGELVEALSTNWAGPTTGGEKLQAFRELMTVHLVEAGTHPYEGYCIYDYFDRELYDRSVGEFLTKLVRTEWPAWGLSKGRRFSLCSKTGLQEVEVTLAMAPPNRVLPYYFPRDEIAGLAAGFVDALFGGQAERTGKVHWCEKTPHNILSPHPRRLFPDCKMIHILRDPRDVAASMISGHAWGPQLLADALAWVVEFYRSWLGLRRDYQNDPNYHEIQFERLVAEPEKELSRLCRFLGLTYHPAMNRVDESAANIGRHRKVFDDEGCRLFHSEVAPLARAAGLELDVFG